MASAVLTTGRRPADHLDGTWRRLLLDADVATQLNVDAIVAEQCAFDPLRQVKPAGAGIRERCIRAEVVRGDSYASLLRNNKVGLRLV